MHTKMAGLLALAGAATFTMGCGGSSKRGSVFENHFPTPAELAKLESTHQVPAKLLGQSPEAIDTWRIDGALPAQLVATPHSDGTPWHTLLTQVAAGRDVALTEDMHCFARAYGGFRLAKTGAPSRALRDFMALRCATTVVSPYTYYLHGDGSGDESLVFDNWKSQAQDMMKEALDAEKGPLAMGVWFGSDAGKRIMVVVSGRRLVSIEPLALVPTGDDVVINGTLTETFQAVRAVINHGRFGFAKCKTDPKVVLPRFSVRCPVDRNDAAELIEVVGFKKGRYLGETVLETMTYPGGQLVDTYARVSFQGEADEPGVPGATAAPAGDTPTRLTVLINDLRGQAKLPSVTLSLAQSAQSRRLAPLYFAATAQEVSEKIADTIVMGLMAGWEIDGVVREGGFTSGIVHGAGEEELLEQMVARPFGREALFDETTQHVAIGEVRSDDGLGVMVTTYSTFTATSSREALAHVLEKLNAERARNGLPPAGILGGASAVLKKIGTMVKRGELSYDEAGDAMMNTLDNPDLRGYSWAANSLDEIEIPATLSKQKNLAVAAVVTYQKVKGVPWAPYVLLLIYGETR